MTIYRGREVTGFAQDDTGVDVALSDGQRLRAEYLVGCDGGRSLVRKAAGIDFPGWDPTTSALLAEVEMTEEPELGIRRDALGHPRAGQGRVRDQGRRGGLRGGRDGRRDADRVAGRHQRAHPARSQRGPHRRLRDRLRDPQSHLDHQVHRHDPAGRGLPQGTGPAGRRRGARAFPGRRTGPQHGRAGRGEPGLEAGAGGQGDLAGKPPRHLPRRAPPGRCPRAAQHDGAGRAMRPDDRIEAVRDIVSELLEHGRAAQAIRREDVRPGHSLRSRRGTPAARTPHARSRPGHRRRPAAGLHPAARARPVLLNFGEPWGSTSPPTSGASLRSGSRSSGAYQVVRGVADRNPTRAFENGLARDRDRARRPPSLRADLSEPSTGRTSCNARVSWTYWNSEFTVLGLALLFVYLRQTSPSCASATRSCSQT